jgi:hypothetical protein
MGISAIHHLVAALRDPASVATLTGAQWSAMLSVARAEVLIGTLAERVAGQPMPARVARLLDAARVAAQQAHTHALWEARMCAEAFAALNMPVILLKGTAYAAAGLPPAPGRQIGDLDILVPRDLLAAAEVALLGAGWEWVKDDPYDQAYYRDHMHELPPLIHSARDRMIDVHHTILPLTARPRPDAAALVADAVDIGAGLAILSPTDMICHAAAHLIADGDLAGGLRNLWDIDRLLRHFSVSVPNFWSSLTLRAQQHQLWFAVHRAARLAHALYTTPLPESWVIRDGSDTLFLAHLLARDDWGRERRPVLRLFFYIRSHWMRMPPLKLARHLWTKFRKSPA